MSEDKHESNPPESTPATLPVKTGPDNQTAPKSAQSEQRNLAQPIAVAALLIAMGTLVGGYFIWHEVQRQAAWQQQVLGQIDSRSQTLDERLQSFKDRLDSDLATTERGRRSLEDEQRRLVNAQQGLEDALGVLRAQVGSSQNDWVLAEVQYLLQVANQRIQLDHDPVTASAALSSADRRLQTLADPGFNGVREEIARELTALQAVAQPDLAGIALTLETLAGQVDQLPLKDAQVRHVTGTQDTDATQEQTANDWLRLPRLIWQELRSLVVVRRNTTPIGPLLAPEQQFFLYANLRLQLNSARLAALQGETASYRASLKTADTWLGDYFEADAPQVVAARAELERLAAADLRPQLPDLSASLRLLRQQMHLADLERPATGDEAAP